MSFNSCQLCGSSNLVLLQIIDEKPERETDFGIPPEKYRRSIYRCVECSVYNNFNNFDLTGLYSHSYNNATYKNDILNKYNQIMGFPYEKSDNRQRVSRIVQYFKKNGRVMTGLKVLDIGSGLCVFLGELLKHGIEAHCVDPDFISVEHALNNVHVKSAIKGGFENYPMDQKFDLISFNKVLEHVLNPIDLLLKAKSLLDHNGFIYIELPDGENASGNGGYLDREEFYIEHYTAFDKESVQLLIEKAGLNCQNVNEIHEPSDKYTLNLFLNKKSGESVS
jgi:SAM-dependent methyltransferase